MARNIFGGGSKTNLNGLKFEQETSLVDLLSNSINCDVIELDSKNLIFANDKHLGEVGSKNKLYKQVLESWGINYKDRVSKKLLPDDYFLNYSNRTLYIIEKKFQNASGSVDEKLQTCDFKLKQYKKLLKGTNYSVKYIYILNDWFKDPAYRDVLEYIHEMNCHYFFYEIPIEFLGI